MDKLKQLESELNNNNIKAEYVGKLVKIGDSNSMFIKYKNGVYHIQEHGEIPDKFGFEKQEDISGVVNFIEKHKI
jgi:hypothetical protein